jgi:hypothetical protein
MAFGQKATKVLLCGPWEWDGQFWTLVSDMGPPLRSAAGRAWDSASKNLLWWPPPQHIRSDNVLNSEATVPVIALGGSAAPTKGSAQPPKALIVLVRNVLRARMRRQGGPSLARQGRREDAVHRAGQSLREWLLRDLQIELRDKELSSEIFTTIYDAEVLVENWRRRYNTVRHSSLDCRSPAPHKAIMPPVCGLPYAPLKAHTASP